MIIKETFFRKRYDYHKKQLRWSDEDLANLRHKEPDYTKLDELAKKDDELFPPPEPLRVEVAGAILNFMSDEAVLVVDMACSQLGKKVAIEFDDRWISAVYGSEHRIGEILARSGAGETCCAAIFNHIPFVTDEQRHRQEVLSQLRISRAILSH